MKQKRFVPVIWLVLVLGLLSACGMSERLIPSAEVELTVRPTERLDKARPTPTLTKPANELPPAERVEIRWFVGLGAGANVGDPELQQAVVDQFNASQDEIELVLEITGDAQPYDRLATAIASGNPPDIVGPVGIRGRDSFKGVWMDLEPMIKESNYDLSVYDPAMVKFYRVKGEGQLGIPFGIFPSFVFVNKDLFNAAGLPYPPQRYGAPYIDENGEEKPWNTDTLRELAMKLTVDANGNNATNPYFNAGNIIQFGYYEQYTDMRGALTLFGAGSPVADDGKTARMPDYWRAGTKWIYDAMWKDHFWPIDATVNNNLISSDYRGDYHAFQSGRLAMAHVHLWFAAPWALSPDVIDFAWDTAVVPEYHGRVTAKMHADTFHIPKGSGHPEQAFRVLTYLLSEEVAPKLLEIYGDMPAHTRLQKDYLKTYSEKMFPGQNINWQVVVDSIQYADIPNHESWMPNFYQSIWIYDDTWTRLAEEPGLDVDAELDALVEKLQLIYDAADG